MPWLILVVALAGFALLGWQGASTVGRSGPLDAAAYLLDAQYLDAHGRLVPAYIGYEYSSPPLFEALAVGLERVVRAAPAWPLELSSNVATRLLWLLLVAVSAGCLISARAGVRLLGAAGLVLGTLWGLDEAVALAKSQTWSAGQLLALVAAVGLVAVSALIARELWPGPSLPHPRHGGVRDRLPGRASPRRALPSRDDAGIPRRARDARPDPRQPERLAAPLGPAGRRALRARPAHAPERASSSSSASSRRRSSPAGDGPAASRSPPSLACAAPRRALARLRGGHLGQPPAGQPPGTGEHGRGRRAALLLRLVPVRLDRHPPLPSAPGERAPAPAPRRPLERLVWRLPPAGLERPLDGRPRHRLEPEPARAPRRRARDRRPRRDRTPGAPPRGARAGTGAATTPRSGSWRCSR